MISDIGLGSLGVYAWLHNSGEGERFGLIVCRSAAFRIDDDEPKRIHPDVLKSRIHGFVSPETVLCAFGVDMNADATDIWITHDGDRISPAIVVGIIADLTEAHITRGAP